MGWFDDAVDAVADAAQDAADAAAAAAQAIADAAAAAAAAAAQAAEDAAKAAAAAAEAVAEAAAKAAADAGDAARAAAEHPLDAAAALAHGAGDAVDTVNQFIADHSGAIIAGAEAVGTVALYATGVGAPLAAAFSGGLATLNDVSNGKDAGDALLDGLAAAGDKLLPGSGDAAKAVVHGLENGETPGEIAREAGLDGVASNGGPLLGYGASFANDVSHGKGAGQILLDAGSQYGNDASGAGTDHSNPLGQVFVAGLNDINDGKSIEQFGLDVAKIYAHDAAGGSASPTGQLSDTFFDDVGKGKSWSEIGDDLLHQAEDMAKRVEHGAPDAIGDAINSSGLPGSSYVATVVGDVVQGKTPEQIAGDVGREAAHDLADQSGLSDTVNDLGIDTSALNPLKPYGETLVNDVVDGKTPDEIAIDLLKQGAKDAGSEAGIDLGSGDKAAEKLFDDATHGKNITDTLSDAARQLADDAVHAAGVDTDSAKGALDAIAHAGDGNDSGDHPPFALTSSELHHAGSAADMTSDAPSFVSNLVDNTYDHIVQSSVQQMNDAAPVSAVEGDFWSEAAQAVNAGSATTLQSGAVVISNMTNAIDPVAHEGAGDTMPDFGHAITSIETVHTPVIDHFAAPTAIELVHAPEFATHMHL